MKPEKIKVSSLGKTFILDIDGTVVKHNGYKIDGKDTLLPETRQFFEKIKEEDMVIFVTSRGLELKEETEKFFIDNGIRFDHIIYNAPFGERILINDKKPSGLQTAIAINTERDEFCKTILEVDNNL